MSIKQRIKSLLALEDVKLNELSKMLLKKGTHQIAAGTLSKKLNRESIKFNEVEEILDILGYDVIFQKREQ